MEASGASKWEEDFAKGIDSAAGRVSPQRFDHELGELIDEAIGDGGITDALQDSGVGNDELAAQLRPRLIKQGPVRTEIAALAFESDRLRGARPAEPSREGEWTRRSTLGATLVGGFMAVVVLGAVALGISLLSDLAFRDLEFYVAVGAALFTLAIAVGVPRRERRLREEIAIWTMEKRALEERREELLQSGILTELRGLVNELLTPAFNRSLAPADSSGLRDLFDPRYEVPVNATAALGEALGSIRAGSIGIAGPRGVGKTTLIRAACEGRLGDNEDEPRERPMGLLASAPIRYGGQEFVRFLFTLLCLEVVPGELGRLERRRRAQRRQELGLAIAGVAIMVAVAGAWASFLSAGPSDQILIPALTGLSVLVSLVALVGSWRRMLERRRMATVDPVEAMAEESLARLRYSETLSEEVGAQATYRWLSVSEKRGRSRAEQPWSYPEVIAKYREFVRLLAEQRPLVIGIDELDKMANAEEARSFLNEMKSLFDQERVSYLVSVSEEALSDFERRGQPLRDVFDSVFSDILRIDYLSRAESEALLRRRAIGIPPPWPALFHSLAGGLPRESIRVARSAVRIAGSGNAEIGAVATGLLAERCASHEHAAAVLAQGEVARDGTQPVLSWLRGLPKMGTNVDTAVGALRARLDVGGVISAVRAAEESSPEGSAARLERLVAEMAAGWYHSVTCLEFFGELDERRFEHVCASSGDAVAAIDLLAYGHQDLSRAPALAWETVSEFRELADLERLEYPLASGAAIG